MTKKIFWIIILIFIILGASFFIFLNNNLSARLLWWGVSIDPSSFSLVSFDKNETRVLKVEKLEAINGTTKVFIDKTETEDHRKYIEDKKFLLESLFLPTTSPYPEVITNVIECPSEFRPKVRNADNGIVYALFAGERYNYGICAKDLVKYDSEYGIFDCKEKGIFEIRLFGEKGEIGHIMKSFKC